MLLNLTLISNMFHSCQLLRKTFLIQWEIMRKTWSGNQARAVLDFYFCFSNKTETMENGKQRIIHTDPFCFLTFIWMKLVMHLKMKSFILEIISRYKTNKWPQGMLHGNRKLHFAPNDLNYWTHNCRRPKNIPCPLLVEMWVTWSSSPYNVSTRFLQACLKKNGRRNVRSFHNKSCNDMQSFYYFQQHSWISMNETWFKTEEY